MYTLVLFSYLGVRWDDQGALNVFNIPSPPSPSFTDLDQGALAIRLCKKVILQSADWQSGRGLVEVTTTTNYKAVFLCTEL